MTRQEKETVTGFEIDEAGLPAVLRNAIEDQRAVVDYMQGEQDLLSRLRMRAQKAGAENIAEEFGGQVVEADRIMFQALRVLGLLEAMQEREAQADRTVRGIV